MSALHAGDKIAAAQYFRGFCHGAGMRGIPEGAAESEDWKAGYDAGIEARDAAIEKCGHAYKLKFTKRAYDEVIDESSWWDKKAPKHKAWLTGT